MASGVPGEKRLTAPIIEGDDAEGRVDLSAIDFDKLAKLFASRPRTAAEQLRSEVEAKAHELVARNLTRIGLCRESWRSSSKLTI